MSGAAGQPAALMEGVKHMSKYKVMRIDPRSVTEETLTFAAGVLTINVPQRSFSAGCPYFLRIVDPIPAETTIGAAVVITIGTGTVEYPLLDCNGGQVTAERLRTGYSYPIELIESGTTGAFQVQAPLRYCRTTGAFMVDGTEGGDGA